MTDPLTGSLAEFSLTGDHRFPVVPGRTTTPEEFDSLITGLENEVFGVYSDDTVV